MAKRQTPLADLDIEGEALNHQDGLAERLARQRGRRLEGEGSAPRPAEPPQSRAAKRGPPVRDANAWRRGKALLQVAVPEDAHVELSVIAKRRRMTLSQVVKAALNDWLSVHGHALRLPD